MNTFNLEILSPERTFYSGESVSLTVPISDGMLGIMANHTPLTAAISDGEIDFTLPDGQKLRCAVTRGMVDINGNRVRVLCETAVAPDEIDAERERLEADKAALEMQKKQSHKDYLMWQLSFNKAVNRLKVKNKETNINM